MIRALAALVLLAPGMAFAQERDEQGREIRYEEKTVIDFDAIDVEGELVKPEEKLLTERDRARFNPLIRLRENFDVEMKQSVDEVK
jgi:hypothetical protein